MPSYTVHEQPSTTAPPHAPSASPPNNAEDGKRLPYACFNCPEAFCTKGRLRKHHNRKHNHRYFCDLCHGCSFGLAGDLKRHNKYVHKQLTDSDKTYQCTLPGCSTPDKIFGRKDNFARHVERCRKRIGKGKGKESASFEVEEE